MFVFFYLTIENKIFFRDKSLDSDHFKEYVKMIQCNIQEK